MMINDTRTKVFMAGTLALTLVTGFALAGARATTTRTGGQPAAKQTQVKPPQPIVVVVTDLDPAAVFDSTTPVVPASMPLGPFDAHKVMDLHVLSVVDRTVIGDAPFDQRTRFILPDGGVYEERTTPVDPAARRASLAGKELDLTGYEFSLLHALASRAPPPRFSASTTRCSSSASSPAA